MRQNGVGRYSPRLDLRLKNTRILTRFPHSAIGIEEALIPSCIKTTHLIVTEEGNRQKNLLLYYNSPHELSFAIYQLTATCFSRVFQFYSTLKMHDPCFALIKAILQYPDFSKTECS